MRFRHATFFQQQRQHVACRRPQGLHKLTRNKLLYWDTGHGTITTSTYVCMYVCLHRTHIPNAHQVMHRKYE